MRMTIVLGVLLGLCAGPARAADPPQQTFVVYFQEWSAAIDGPAVDVIARAAEWAKGHAGSTARVTGFADPTGSHEANILLSQLRAQVVADGLKGNGLATGRIRQSARGSVPFAATALESRRVEIRFGR